MWAVKKKKNVWILFVVRYMNTTKTIDDKNDRAQFSAYVGLD